MEDRKSKRGGNGEIRQKEIQKRRRSERRIKREGGSNIKELGEK